MYPATVTSAVMEIEHYVPLGGFSWEIQFALSRHLRFSRKPPHGELVWRLFGKWTPTPTPHIPSQKSRTIIQTDPDEENITGAGMACAACAHPCPLLESAHNRLIFRQSKNSKTVIDKCGSRVRALSMYGVAVVLSFKTGIKVSPPRCYFLLPTLLLFFVLPTSSTFALDHSYPPHIPPPQTQTSSLHPPTYFSRSDDRHPRLY